MIKLFNNTETVFNTSNGIKSIKAFKAKVTKGIWANKEYYLDIEVPISYIDDFVQDRILVVPTCWDEQAFRIGNVVKKGDRLKSRAYHVSYDCLNYVLRDVYPHSKTGQLAMQWVIDRTDDANPFTCESDILDTHSARYVNKSLFEAFTDMEKVWNGYLIADNYKVSLMGSIGANNGASFNYGVNIQNIQVSENWDDVVTKLYAKGYDGATITPLLSTVTYDKKYNKVIEFSPSASVEFSDKDAVLADLQTQAQEYIAVNQYPKISYSLKTYIDKVFNVGDKVLVKHAPLKIDITTEVYSLTYNVLSKNFDACTFGNYKENVKGLFTSIQTQMEKNKEVTNKRYTALQEAITASKNLINHYLFEGHKFETESATYYLNTEGVNEATKFLIVSLGGIGFGTKRAGEDITQADYTTIWDIEGNFDAKCIVANSITASQIASHTITANEIAAAGIKAENIDTIDLFAQNITASGTITGATLIGTNAEIAEGKIGKFEIVDGLLSCHSEDSSENAIALSLVNGPLELTDWSQHRYSSVLKTRSLTFSNEYIDATLNALTTIINKIEPGQITLSGYLPVAGHPTFDARITTNEAQNQGLGIFCDAGIFLDGGSSTGILVSSIKTTSGADLDELNSNLSDKIQVLEEKSIHVYFASTKTQGRPNVIAVPLSKDYRGIRQCIYLEQGSNVDWVVCTVYGIDGTNCYIQYQNYYTSAIAGCVSIRILG